jgi:hypothetical protein
VRMDGCRNTQVVEALAAFFVFAACLFSSVSAESSPASKGVRTNFRALVPGKLQLRMSIEGGKLLSFFIRGRVSCESGRHHWWLFLEGGPGPGQWNISREGRFHWREFFPGEAPVRDRPSLEQIEEEAEEGIGSPAEFQAMAGRVYANKVVGRYRFWENPQLEGKRQHTKCGTGSPEGEWVPFVARRIKGPPQPHGHWKGTKPGGAAGS